MKSGFVSIVGRPNVGKSTLLNNILGRKLAITSDKSGTTRNIIQGVYNDEDSQIVFVDTPGIHKPRHKLENVLNQKAYSMTHDIDLVLFLVDIKDGFGKGDEFILEKLKQDKEKVILVLNKIDKISNKEILLQEIDRLKDLYNFVEIVPISSLKDINVLELIKTIKKYLPEEERAFFDKNYITNLPTNLMVCELVREKILRNTEDEIPHSVTCYLENYEETETLVNLGVLIVVDRDNLKKIIIGKNGNMLKKIGTDARYDLEEYFNKKVFLSLYVKTIKNWRDREKYLMELGLKDDLDFE
ncbi:MAG: GTPase Era [Bacilli bacterium]|nr:GTPase Era [Bacilli bacterium]